MPKDEWDAIRSLADERNIVIKKADKVPVWLSGIEMTIYLRLTNN